MNAASVVTILRQQANADGFRYGVERRHLTMAADAIEELMELLAAPCNFNTPCGECEACQRVTQAMSKR